MSSDRLDALEARVAAIEARLAAPVGTLDTEALRTLASAGGTADCDGAVRVSGSVRVGQRRVSWQTDHAAAALVQASPEPVAAVLAAAGHPLRLAVLRALLDGPATSAELAERVSPGSTGQLYHHLDKLAAAGLIDQPSRGTYALPASHVVPVLVLIAACLDISGDPAADSAAP